MIDSRVGWMRIGLVAAAWLALSSGLRAQCMQWTELSVANPPPASYNVWRAEMLYDKARHKPTLLVDYHPSYPNRVLVYTLSGTSWTMHNPAVAPFEVNAACYHDQRATVIAWCAGDQLWEWNGATWSLITHAGPWPNSDNLPLMTYDPVRHRVILLTDSTTALWDDTWEWTGTAWEQGPSVGPDVPYDLCFDTVRNVAFVYGGAPGGLVESYWEYTPGTSAAFGQWTPITPSMLYAPYEGASITYDAFRGEILRIGRMQWSPPSYSSTTEYWDPTGPRWWWHDPGPGSLFPYDKRRSQSAMCFDSDADRVVLFGGRRHEFPGIGTSWTYYNDTWVFNRQDPGIVVDLPPTKSWCAGQTGVLSITVAGNASVQWWKDNQPIAGATSTILVINPVTPASAGVYECEVANSCGGLWSRPCTASVTVAPAITAQPIGDECCPGQTVHITGPGVTGTSPQIDLQRYNGQAWVSVPHVYNPLGNFYDLPNAQNSQSGMYRFEVSNSCGTVYSMQFPVQVGITISVHPMSETRPPCSVVQVSLSAQGVGAMTYQWRRNGVPLEDDGRITGAHSVPLRINGMRYEDEGTYDCVITDACESKTTNGAVLTMQTPQWVHRTSSGPRRRLPTSTDMVYDAARGVTVLYGGCSNFGSVATFLGDTWEWDGVSWTQRFPPHSPGGPRIGHDMVYDSIRGNVLILFGQATAAPNPYNPGIWEYDGTDWTLLTNAPGGPPGGWVQYGEAAFDPIRGKVIATDWSANTYTCDTWEFDPTTLVWVRTVTGSAPSYQNHQTAWDPSLGAVLSSNHWPSPGGQTLRYTGTTWAVQGADPPRHMPAIAFDAFRNRMTMFGCCRDTYGLISQNNLRTNTYAFIGAAWQQVLPEFHPTQADALWPVAMAFDTRRNAMVVIGNSFNTFVGTNPVDTWEYQYADKVVFDRQPEDQPLTIGGSAQFSVFAAGAGTLTYQWRKGTTLLVNGPMVKGGVISGAQTNTLTITGLTAANAGTYRCEVSNACGSALSDPADLGTVCYPDCNGSGTVTVSDFGCFQVKYVLGDLYADCNQSGTLSVADFGCFQSAFVAGCP
ncbi:MAG: immunoglobulin domain-containing protein [Phycisphaerales bacterium]